MRGWRRSGRWLVSLLCGTALAGCSLIKPLPKPMTLEERLAAIPTQQLPIHGWVRIYWNESQIPFIEAETDDDAAFALGLVHAHLRLSQMAVYRQIAQGRIAEMGGPLAIDIDHGIRILDFGHSTAATLATMPEETRRWLQRFVDGVNHYQAKVEQLPFEYGVLAPSRTQGGGAILANDPHLGINLPNTWLLAGVKSPSYHAVGLMVPGLPLFGIGRNPWIAWGGTNMRASASDLISVRALPDAEENRGDQTIRVRWWPDQKVTLRGTRFGPILSDAPQLRDLDLGEASLRWTGHLPSDEVTAMLKVARARDFEEFRSAFASFSVPGQNMLYADAKGNIGQVMAVQVPDRQSTPKDLVIEASDADRSWQTLRDATTLPAMINPEEGFIASANNRPANGDAIVGWFFSPDDRVRRMAALVEENGTLGVEQVKAMQRDVHVGSSAELNQVLVRKMREAGKIGEADSKARRVFDAMAAWDGQYKAEAQAPVAFELLRFHFTRNFYEAIFGDTDWAAFANVGRIKDMLIEDIERADARTLTPMLRRSLEQAAEKLDAFPTWGDMHRLELRHPLAFLPVVGQRFQFADYPIGGSSDSLMKTAHASTDQRHRASYGANARHVSDLSDMDRNWFVLLGGQDGWLNSSTFLDQVPLWLEGRYLEMPLRLETVRAQFRYVTDLGS